MSTKICVTGNNLVLCTALAGGYVIHTHLHCLNTLDRAAKCPVSVWTLEVGTSHSHHTDRANSTGGAVAWILKLQKMMGGCLSTALLPRQQRLSQCYFVLLQEAGGVTSVEEKVLIREI